MVDRPDKYKEPHIGMNPGIWIYADKIQPDMGSEIELAESYLTCFSDLVENPQCVEQPTIAIIGGLKVVKTALAYHGVVEEDNFAHDVVDYTRIAYHRGHVIWFLFEHSFDGTVSAASEFERVDKSINFT